MGVPKIYQERSDTACPLRNISRVKERIDKWPNAIAVGFGKCGTGALSFIDCHSEVVFRLVEPVFFSAKQNLRTSVPKSYLNMYNIPKAAENEILIEKSPPYMQGGAEALRRKAENMKKAIPDLKILAFVCDPI